jgi:hypothetical protein
MSPLEPEVEQLLAEIVEWVTSVPRGSGRTIIVTRTQTAATMRLSADAVARPVVWEDVETLIHEDLLRRSSGSSLEVIAQVTPAGFEHYEQSRKREANPWAEVSEDERARLVAGPTDNSPFTPPERGEVIARIERIEMFLLDAEVRADQDRHVIMERLDYLKEAAGRLGRFDWRGLAMSTVIDLAILGYLNPKDIRAFVDFIGGTAQHLLR